MGPKILLINYTESEAKAVEMKSGVKVVRGYMGDELHVFENHAYFDYYAPEAFYEFTMVFIKLGNYERLATEFERLSRDFDLDDTKRFRKYWRQSGRFLTIFMNETEHTDLYTLGVPLDLEESKEIDTISHLEETRNPKLKSFFAELKSQICLPASKIIKVMGDSQFYYSSGTDWHSLVSNSNNDMLATVLTKGSSDYSMEEPGVLILPKMKAISVSTNLIIDVIGDYYGTITNVTDWKESDNFYPQAKILSGKKHIVEIQEESKSRIEDTIKELREHMVKYGYLKDLVTSNGKKLENAVQDVLQTVLGLNVKRSDEDNKGNLKEDFVVEVDGKEILIEVKGTKNENPSLMYPSQPQINLARAGYSLDTKVALILNHDLEKDPKIRKNAYDTVETRELIKNIYFIDTRVLKEVALMVIESKITQSDALAILFEKYGRANIK